MKVIDLLNKIANGEPLPNEICLECVNSINEHNCYYHFSPIFESYINDDNTLIQNATNLATLLNLKVEIIEEDKKIEKLENEKWFYDYATYDSYEDKIDKVLYLIKAINLLETKINIMNDKVNEIIDKINEEK